MPEYRPNIILARSAKATTRPAIGLLCAWLAGAAQAAAAPGDNASIVRDLSSRVGPIVGSALVCRDIAQPRIQAIADKFRAVIRDVSSNEADRDDLSKLFDRYIGDGRSAVTAGRTDCKSADRQLTELEQSLAGPSLSGVTVGVVAAPAPNPPVATHAPAAPVAPPVPTAPPAAAAPQPAAPATMAATTPTVTPVVPPA